MSIEIQRVTVRKAITICGPKWYYELADGSESLAIFDSSKRAAQAGERAAKRKLKS